MTKLGDLVLSGSTVMWQMDTNIRVSEETEWVALL